MSRFKAVSSAFLTFAVVSLILPAAVVAAQASHHKVNRHPEGQVFGSLVSYNADSAVISTNAGNVTVMLLSDTAYVTFDQAAAVAGLQDGDQVLAIGRYFDGTLHVDRLRYDIHPFAVSKLIRFEGRYQSNTSTTLTIVIRRDHVDVARIFNTDANTRYYVHGKRVSAPTYEPNERIRVWARQFSDQSWLAKIVNLLPKDEK